MKALRGVKIEEPGSGWRRATHRSTGVEHGSLVSATDDSCGRVSGQGRVRAEGSWGLRWQKPPENRVSVVNS